MGDSTADASMTIKNGLNADRYSIPPRREWDPADIPDSLWRILASPYLTMWLLAAIAALVCLALFLPQRPATVLANAAASSAWLAALRERYGPGANWLLGLGLADIRQGRWLRGFLGLLALNLALVAVDWIRPRHLRLSVLDPVVLTVPGSASQRPEDVLEPIRRSLQASRFRLVEAHTQDGHFGQLLIHADRFVLFPLLVYLGVLLAMGGLVLSERTTWWEQNVILRPGQVRSIGHGTGLAFRAQVLDRVGDLASTPSSRWQTRLSFLRGDREVGQATLWNQTPTIYGGLFFYPVSTEPALLVKVQDQAGQNLALRTPETGATDFRQVALRFRDEDTLRYIVTLNITGNSQSSPHLEQTENERYVLIPDRNLTLRLTYALPTQALAQPTVHIEAFRGAETEPFHQLDITGAASTQIEGDLYAFEVQRYAVVKFGQDYGVVIALLGLAVALAGISLSTWRHPQRLWIVPQAVNDQVNVLVAVNGEASGKAAPWFESVLQGVASAMKAHGQSPQSLPTGTPSHSGGDRGQDSAGAGEAG